jgi:hypothetical protein
MTTFTVSDTAQLETLLNASELIRYIGNDGTDEAIEVDTALTLAPRFKQVQAVFDERGHFQLLQVDGGSFFFSITAYASRAVARKKLSETIYREFFGDAPHETNVEMLTRLMNFSKNGGLMQGFVLTAIAKYAEQCIEAGPQTFDSELLCGAAWIRCAREAVEELEKHTTP